MMNKSIRLILSFSVIFAILASTPAWAASSKKGKRVKVGRTVYDFDEVDILGRLKRPEGREIMERPEFRFRRLLDLDESFLPNITRAVDEF